ncbi:MAG: biotin synthase, partial [Firmicutes bacterium]|nr:biotin synthase [Bacillota bacterium]
MEESLMRKLQILADSAKYDVSCSSSGAARHGSGQMGSAHMSGICHTWAADGRCVSLLKVLFTNNCVYNCAYCVSRRDNDFPRASFEPEELAALTMEFYRRNYIEGLFLSSAVEVSPDYTAERILQCLTILREAYGFAGYIHAKIIPGVSPEILHRIGLVADRLSVNIELPTEESLKKFAPQKK